MDTVEAGVLAWEEKKKESTQRLFGNDKQKQNDKARERTTNPKNARKYLDRPSSVFPPKQATSGPIAPIPNLNPYPPSGSPSMPVHFNSKGEFIFPHSPFQTILTPAQMIAPHSIRMCMRFGCGSILTPRNSADEDVFCARCRPLAAVGQFPKTAKPRRAFDADVPITSMKRREVVGKSKDSPIVIPDDVSSTLMPDDLSYPEPEVTVRKDSELVPPPQPVTVSIPQAPAVPRLPPPPLPKKKKTAPAPLRPCATPNCRGLIHASSSAHRCPSCVMKDWKNRISNKGKEQERKERVGIIVIPAKRKREQFQASEPATTPSVSEPSIPVPFPEKESISGWDSDLTDLSSSDEEALFEGMSRRRTAESGHSGDTTSEDDDDESPPQPARPPAQPVRLVIRIPPRSPEKVAATPSSSSVASSSSTPDPQRKCAITACGALLDQGYAWKCCKACRKHHREYQRKRLGITKGTYTPDKEKTSSSPKPDPQSLPPGYRICTIRYCNTVIPPVEAYKWKMCKACRHRTKMLRRRRQEGVEVPIANDKPPPRKEPRKPVYPEYASFPRLLDDYQQRLRGFFEAQAEWIVMKHRQENEKENGPKKADGVDKHSLRDQHDTGGPGQEKATAKEGELLAFDGEYSVVAMDYAICDRQAAVVDFVGRLRGEIERVGGVAFDPKTRLVTLAHGGILTRYRCVHRIHVTMHDRAEKNDDIRIAKDMHGELEIAILPEYSHPFFPGQRTVIRMRLLG